MYIYGKELAILNQQISRMSTVSLERKIKKINKIFNPVPKEIEKTKLLRIALMLRGV